MRQGSSLPTATVPARARDPVPSPVRRARPRARRGEGHRLRQELIEAASDLLAELGDANQLSLRAVAAAVGVSPPSIYRHFADKQALLSAVLDERWNELNALIAEQAVEDPFVSLRGGCLAYLGFAEEHPGHYRVLFSVASPAGVTRERDTHPGMPSFLLVVETIKRCLDLGAGARADAWALAVRLWVTLHGLVDLRTTMAYPFPWPTSEEFVDALLADLGLSSPGAGR